MHTWAPYKDLLRPPNPNVRFKAVNVVLPSSSTSSTPPPQTPQPPTMSAPDSATLPKRTPEPSLPRRTINDLPVDIKARIVAMCAEQDEQFQRWVSSRKKLAADLKKNGMMHGRSVNALFQVSKKFSMLAAPYLFKVLKASKVDLRFKYSVATLRLSLFKVLDLDSSSKASNGDILPFVRQLSGIRTLKLKEEVIRFYWGGEVPSVHFSRHSSANAQYAALSFATLTHVKDLFVINMSPSRYRLLLPAFAEKLRSLHIHSSKYYGRINVDGLGAILSSTPHLRDLHLHQSDFYNGRQPLDLGPVVAEISAAPPLRHICFTIDALDASLLTFAEYFSATLSHLSFHIKNSNSTSTSNVALVHPLFTTEVLPLLSNLSFEGEHAVVGQTFTSLAPQHAPNLQHISLNLKEVPTWSGSESPLAGLPAFPHLASLSIKNLDEIEASIVDEIFEQCRSNGVELRGRDYVVVEVEPPSDVPLDDDVSISSVDSDDLAMVPTASQAVSPHLRESSAFDTLTKTLDYLEATVKEAAEKEDFATLNRLTGALEGLELQRQAEEAWQGM